jgi:hypothetical protein
MEELRKSLQQMEPVELPIPAAQMVREERGSRDRSGRLGHDRIADENADWSRRDPCLSRPESLHAPRFIDLEVAQVLRRNVATGSILAARAELALDVLCEISLVRNQFQRRRTAIEIPSAQSCKSYDFCSIGHSRFC